MVFIKEKDSQKKVTQMQEEEVVVNDLRNTLNHRAYEGALLALTDLPLVGVGISDFVALVFFVVDTFFF